MNNYTSRFGDFEKPLVAYKVKFFVIIGNISTEASVIIDDVTVKTRVKTEDVLRFDEQSFSFVLLILAPNWYYFAHQNSFREEIFKITPTVILLSK